MKNLRDQIQSAVDIFKSGDYSKAEKVSKKLVNENPKVAFLYNLLGLIFSAQRKREEAIEFYEKGLKIDPKFALIYNNLGLVYFGQKTTSSIKKAENSYKKSIALNDKIAEPCNNLGNLYKSLNKYNEAEDFYKKAISIDGKLPQSHYNLGTLLVTLGKITEAKKCYKEAIKLNPNMGVAHRSLSRITKYTNDEDHLIELKNLYKKININNIQNRIEIGFALGKACEDTKQYDESFSFYEKANYLCKKKVNFRLENEKKKFNNTKEIFNKELFNKFSGSGSMNSSPIFIVGMPRSGTTLTEQILASHPEVFGADEIEFIPTLIKKYFGDHDLRLFFENVMDFDKNNLKIIGDEYISKIKNFSNNSVRTTDKLTINFMSIGIIKIILPNAKIIHCYRNPKDNLFSIFKNYFPGDHVTYSYDLNDMVEYYFLYDDLMKYWNTILNDFIFNLKYENLIANTEGEIKNLLKFCNLEWSKECLNFYKNKRPIKTASDTQARNKIYSTSVNSWENYKKHLKEFFYKLDN